MEHTASATISNLLIGFGTATPFVLGFVLWLRGSARREGVIDTKLQQLCTALTKMETSAAGTTQQIRSDIGGLRLENTNEHTAINARVTQLPCGSHATEQAKMRGELDTLLREG